MIFHEAGWLFIVMQKSSDVMKQRPIRIPLFWGGASSDQSGQYEDST